MEKISVVIPAYRAERYLAEAVDSVEKQSWQGEKEIIVVDDGSDDETFRLAQALGVIALTQKRGGAAAARNLGLLTASGDLLFLLDADDVLMPDALRQLYEPLSSHRELSAVFGRAQDFISPELTEEQKRELRPRSGSYGGVLPGCALIRREAFITVGYFDESLQSGETVAWQLKLRESGQPVTSIDAVTLHRRLHLSNTGRAQMRQELQNYAAILRGRMRRR